MLCHVIAGICLTLWLGEHVTAEQQLTINNLPDHHLKLFKLFSGGLRQLVWNDRTFYQSLSISDQCKKSLDSISKHVDRGSVWAFRFLDASSNSPPGILDGTLSSFGDYDECINIEIKTKDGEPMDVDSPKFTGMYCSMEMEFDASGLDLSSNITNLMKERIPVFGSRNFQFGVCLPSSCSTNDVLSIVKDRLSGYPLKILPSKASCDTMESVSYYERFRKLSVGQIVSLLFLLGIIGSVQLGTQCHLLDMFTKWFFNVPFREYIPVPITVDILQHFSLLKSVEALITVKKSESVVSFVEVSTVALILGTVFAQCAFLLESSLGLSIIHRLHDLRILLNTKLYVPLFSEGFFSILPFVMGYSTYSMTNALISRGKFNLILSIMRKYFKIFFFTAFVLSLEFVWPIISMGPLYTRVSDELMTKCSNTWWRHLLMISNSVSLQEVCAPHLVYSSIFFQLFVIGLVISWMINRNGGIGYSVSAIILAISCRRFLSSTLLSPIIFDTSFTVDKTMTYFNVVHFSLSSQVINYMIGIISASMTVVPISKLVVKREDSIRPFDILATIVLLGFSFFSPLFHNESRSVDTTSFTSFVLIVKVSACLGCHFLSRIWSVIAEKMRYEESTEKKTEEVINNNNVNQVNGMNGTEASTSKSSGPLISAEKIQSLVSEDRVISFPKAFVKLSFSMFLLSVFFIRLDHFASRLLYSVSPYDSTKRMIYTSLYLFMLSGFCHLHFVAPFTALRKTIFGD